MSDIVNGIIIGAAPIGNEAGILLKMLSEKSTSENHDATYVIAADGGIKFLYDNDICPDEWIGDMDSAGNELSQIVKSKFPNISINSCSPIKDDTDMAIATEILIQKGCKNIYIFGGMGGKRIEHSIANIQLMHHLIDRGVKATVCSDNSTMYCLQDDEKSYDENAKGFISVFSLSDSSEVELEGLFYPYKGTITNSYALGVSNEFIGKPARIKISKGTILVVESP